MSEENLDVGVLQEKPKPKIHKFNPNTLNFIDFQEAQPEINRWILIWSNMGSITPNFFISYRDNMGNYHVPDPNKQWALNAWAYLDKPSVIEET